MDVTFILAVAVLMMVVGLAFLYFLLANRPGFKPADPTEWAGSLLSGALVLSSAALIVITLRAAETPAVMFIAAGTEQPEIVDMALATEAGNFSFTSVDDGTEHDLASLEGKVVLLNFWATWCAPCLQEIPELNRLADRYPDDLVVLSLSDEDAQTLTGFENYLDLSTFSAYVPMGSVLPAPFSEAFAIRPTSFIIDREGVVRRYLLGQRSYDIFERFVTPYL
jgi:thiol-disulfide isomerase/thioredoxin